MTLQWRQGLFKFGEPRLHLFREGLNMTYCNIEALAVRNYAEPKLPKCKRCLRKAGV